MENTKERLEHLREYLRRNVESLQQKVDGRTSSFDFADANIELSFTGRQLELLHDSLFVWLERIENENKEDGI